MCLPSTDQHFELHHESSSAVELRQTKGRLADLSRHMHVAKASRHEQVLELCRVRQRKGQEVTMAKAPIQRLQALACECLADALRELIEVLPL
jgi:hypothetical protein